jgi:hypothetical protein
VTDGHETHDSPGRPSTLVDDAPRGASAGRGRHRAVRRRRLLVAAPVAALLVAGGIYLVNDDAPAVMRDRPSGPISEWVSGASVDGDVDDFAEWRGSPVEISGTWADAQTSLQTELPQLRRGGEFADWERDLDFAIGAIGEGETWAEAADGAYDRRWRRSLTTMERLWGDRPGTLYLRFAHEMNGDWYPWKVTADDRDDFITAWQRFRELQQEVFPEAQLVFCLTRESVGSDIDWRETFPGPEYVDVLGVDYYNQYPYVDTVTEFHESATELDDFGGPKGIQGYLDFAREQGLPLAVPEWNGNAREGDSPAFIYSMYEIFARQGGTGPGQVLYEIVFNIPGYDGAFDMYPETEMPDSAEQYRRLW